MNDILPSESHTWQYLEKIFVNLMQSYGYHEIRTPIVENTNLFKRSIGEITDIVEKEMYTFNDRNGDSLTLRPENTASVVRSLIEHGLLQERLKCWYFGQMFRHERPQKGRFRQFHQFGCEVFNLSGAAIDVELIAMSARLWQHLGIKKVELQINSLGSSEARANYRTVLVEFLTKHQLDEDSQKRLKTNPLRILDSKNPEMQQIISEAPKLSDYLDTDSKQHFAKLCQLLTELQIPFVINNRLVRGLDYYNKTVFEWVSNELGAQGTICAGGRYDGLVSQVGGKFTPAVGFAIGAERLLSLIDLSKINQQTPDIYLILADDTAQGLQIAELFRHQNLKVLTNFDAGNFKTQFKRADKSGAKFAVIIGDDELTNSTVSIKNLRENSEQKTIALNKIESWISQEFPSQ